MTYRKFFVNMPVRDLQRSMEFFTRLGFSFDRRLTDEQAACMIIGPATAVLLLESARFAQFTTKAECDTARQTEVVLTLTAEQLDEVEKVIGTVTAAGGRPAPAPVDHGCVYTWSFEDPDGHTWEVAWLDPALWEGPPD